MTSSRPDIVIRNARIVAMNRDRDCVYGDIRISQGVFREVGRVEAGAPLEIDASNKVVIPGFVQSHIHLGQTLFRGLADDLVLLDWLRQRIWPLEGAHDAESAYFSALLGCAELIRGGTTCVLDMESVHHCDSALEAISKAGIRANVGKALMDTGDEVPSTLRETTSDAIEQAVLLFERWHMRDGGRIRCHFAPRFVLSCSEELLRMVAEAATERGALVHSHAAENREETELVRKQKGCGNVEYFHKLGLTGPRLALAHCIWLDENELRILRETETNVLHCPSSNMKLGSGLARVSDMIRLGVPVSLGADGAANNNNLDMFNEMRLAALIQSVIEMPGALPSSQVLEMATMGGARALGIQDEVGSIEVGKKADLSIVDVRKVHASPRHDLASTLVYAVKSNDVETCIIDGRVVMNDRKLLTIDEEETLRESQRAADRVKKRLGLA